MGAARADARRDPGRLGHRPATDELIRISESVREALPGVLPGLGVTLLPKVPPHGLPVGALTTPMKRAFQPLGFRMEKGTRPGIWTATKRSPANHTLRVKLDRGPVTLLVDCSLEVHGPGFFACVNVPLRAGDRVQVPVQNAEELAHMLDGAARIVAWLEETWVPRHEALAPRGPVWWDDAFTAWG